MNAIHKFRSASNGKVFTRRERVNIIESEKTRKARAAIGKELVALELSKVRKETEARQEAARIRNFTMSNPDMKIKGIKRDASGNLVFQPRVGGKFQPKMAIP